MKKFRNYEKHELQTCNQFYFMQKKITVGICSTWHRSTRFVIKRRKKYVGRNRKVVCHVPVCTEWNKCRKETTQEILWHNVPNLQCMRIVCIANATVHCKCIETENEWNMNQPILSTLRRKERQSNGISYVFHCKSKMYVHQNCSIS